jgi:hypothetical protein
MTEENKKTATERLEILENTVQNIIQAVQPVANIAQDLMGLREAVKLLNNKLDSTIKALNTGIPLTEENIKQFMVDNNVKELQEKVSKMVNDGLLVSTNTVGKDSFVVISEIDASGKVVNPRAQFLLSALQNEEIRSKLEGSTVGATLSVGDKGGALNVLEAYNISTPQAPMDEAGTPEAATAEASSADAATSAPEAATASESAPAAADSTPETAATA